MPHNPDNRADNVENIQAHISNTIENMDEADEMLAQTSDPKHKDALVEKNKRRQEALDGMRQEIRDEASAQQKGQF